MSMKEKTFGLTISGVEHHEWQGTLRTPDGEALPFRSALELLKLLDTQIKAQKLCQ
jgi:hypothetical protein